MNFSDSKFSQSVNLVKGFAILLVVLGHIASPLTALIYSFHIPLFFFIGGLFMSTSNTFFTCVVKGFNRLILPYLIFGSIGFSINCIKNIFLHRTSETFLHSMVGLLGWMDLDHLNHYGMVLWFLPALFWGRLIVYFLAGIVRINDFILIVFLISSALLITKSPNLLFGIDNAIFATPWIGFGFVVSKYKQKLLTPNTTKLILMFFVSLWLFFEFFGEQRIDVATKNIGNPIITMTYTFSIVFTIFYATYYLTGLSVMLGGAGKFLEKFGKYSLLVLVLHPYTNNIAHLVVTFFWGDGLWAVKFLLTVVMLIMGIWLREAYSKNILFRYL